MRDAPDALLTPDEKRHFDCSVFMLTVPLSYNTFLIKVLQSIFSLRAFSNPRHGQRCDPQAPWCRFSEPRQHQPDRGRRT
jgi:hypothetical protein